MDLSKATFLLIDLETTGMDPQEDRIVELGAVVMNHKGEILGEFLSLVNPGRPIPSGASAVHFLTDDDVKDAPPLKDALAAMDRALPGYNIVSGHNIIDFDSKFLPKHDFPVLDTLKLARKLYPDFESHKNQFLRYELKLKVPNVAREAHNALADIRVTAAVLNQMLKELKSKKEDGKVDLPKVIDWTLTPNLLKTVRFGKHKGTPWASVDKSYLQWMLGPKGMTDLDVDTKYTAQFYASR